MSIHISSVRTRHDDHHDTTSTRRPTRRGTGVDIVTLQQEAPTTCDVDDDDALGGGTRLEWNDGCETTTTTIQRTRAHATHVQDDDDDDAGGSVSTR